MNSEFNAIDFDELMDQALRLPDGDAKLADVAQMGKYYKNTALDYAYKYDQRNGNDYRSNEILELCQFSELK